MESLAGLLTDLLWRSALAVIPLALLTAALCRWLSHAPGTRHGLWLLTLCWLVVGAAVPAFKAGRSDPSGPTATPEAAFSSPVPTVPPAFPEPNPALPAMPQAVPGEELAIRPVDAPWPVETDASRTPVSEPAGRLGDAAAEPWSPLDGAAVAPNRSPSEWDVSLTSPSGRQKAVGWVRAESRRDRVPASEARLARPRISVDQAAEDGAPFWGGVRREFHRVRQWTGNLADVRDSLGQYSPIPASLWLVGASLVMTVYLATAWRFRRRLRSGRPASPSVRRTVAHAARSIGLRRPPEIRFTDEPVSPMVWAGARTVLLLPLSLWNDLDEIGQRAVVCHELAHLRRRDHWVRWIDLLIGALYWWHPVVWWIRGRLRAEAECCCDAWVTWLLPGGRRAYAEALLTTRQFVSQRNVAAPAVGICVTTRPAKRLARRLTMIMTRMDRPWMTSRGVLLALAVAFAGWLAVPAYSGSPDKADCDRPCAKSAKAATKTTCKPSCQTAAKAPCRPKCKTPCASTPPAKSWVEVETTTGVPVLVAGGGGQAPCATVVAGSSGHRHEGHDAQVLQRVESLERQLERLSRQLDKLSRALGHEGVPGPIGVAVKPPKAPKARKAPRAPRPPTVRRLPFGREEVLVREYQLPPGKLKALTELMVRNDVPVLVSPEKDHLKVHGTESQHQIFQAFVDLIEGRETELRFGLTPSDAPAPPISEEFAERIAELATRASESVAAEAMVQAELQARQAALRQAHAVQAQARAEQIMAQMEVLQAQAADLEVHGDELEAKAEELREKAEVVREELTGSDREAAAMLRTQLQTIEAAIRDVERAARETRRQARQMERQADRLETRMDRFEDRDHDLEAED